MMRGKHILLFVGYAFFSIALLLYSYTQVDLNLTLSRVTVWQTIQKSFQYIGYYQRPLSTLIYVFLLFAGYGLYFYTLSLIARRKLSVSIFWKLLGIVIIPLLISYPAFSYDMFNYMFTAKTVLVYHKNPYAVIPLQFLGIDPWLTFMRWTHLPSAYTPLWVLLTLPAYALGFGYLLLVMWNIKLLVAIFYILTVWGIGKIIDQDKKANSVWGMALFALNPLVLIEGLVSSHNDMVMMGLSMVSLCLLYQKKRWWSFWIYAASVGAKLMTIFLLPLYLIGWNRRWALSLMAGGFVLVLFQREVLPWYFLWILPFVAILPTSFDLLAVSAGISLGLLLRYAPYLYLGHWDNPVPTIKVWVTLVPIAVAVLVVVSSHLLLRFRHDKR